MERGRYTEYRYTFSVVKIYNIKVDTFLHQVRVRGGGGFMSVVYCQVIHYLCCCHLAKVYNFHR